MANFIIYYAQEDLVLKVINDSHQKMYFHYVKSFADFNFNENFNSSIDQNNYYYIQLVL